MTQPAQQQGQQGQGAVAKLPQAVIDSNRFEGKEVAGTIITVQGSAKMTPLASDPDDVVLTHDDVVTIQMDVKVSGVGYDVDGNGLLVRTQRVRPIEGSVTIVDVLRARDTKIR